MFISIKIQLAGWTRTGLLTIWDLFFHCLSFSLFWSTCPDGHEHVLQRGLHHPGDRLLKEQRGLHGGQVPPHAVRVLGESNFFGTVYVSLPR